MRELQEEQGLAHVHEGVVRRAFTPCARNVICTCEMSWAQCKKCYLQPPLYHDGL